MASDGKIPDGDEPQYVLDMPVAKGDWRPRTSETEARVLGFPTSWIGPRSPLDLGWMRHPVLWTTWRRRVRRDGPHAPTFGEWCAQRQS